MWVKCYHFDIYKDQIADSVFCSYSAPQYNCVHTTARVYHGGGQIESRIIHCHLSLYKFTMAAHKTNITFISILRKVNACTSICHFLSVSASLSSNKLERGFKILFCKILVISYFSQRLFLFLKVWLVSKAHLDIWQIVSCNIVFYLKLFTETLCRSTLRKSDNRNQTLSNKKSS